VTNQGNYEQVLAQPSDGADDPPPVGQQRVVDEIVDELQRAGVQRIYGMPGGGSNMMLIDAATRRGLEFVLVHHEPAAVFMAAGEAETTGVPGVCLATLGPGVASSANGLAHCKLDRVPLLLITDRADSETYLHQLIDHAGLVGAAVKSTDRIGTASPRSAIRRALATALELPHGPVHLDLAPNIASAPAEAVDGSRGPAARHGAARGASVVDVAAVLRGSERPAIIAGLRAREPRTVGALRALAERFGIPVLTTYKAKGVLDESHPLANGLVTNGALEGRVLEDADTLVVVGLDVVELMPGAWRWPVPTVAIDAVAFDSRHVPADVALLGDSASLLAELGDELAAAGWRPGWDHSNRPTARLALHEVTRSSGAGGVPPGEVAEIARRLAPEGSIATVDAGSHMFAATLFWTCDRPRRFLISNGLSTMGYSLPAAIGASLAWPDDLVVCFTGDGGLAMTVGELETVARLNPRLVMIVFDDRSLNLIKIKQEKRGETTVGLDFGPVDWAKVARAMGVFGSRVATGEEFAASFERAVVSGRPALIDVVIDPSSYPLMLNVVRG
jgi:acetolactate synthase I/II/III large subunit